MPLGLQDQFNLAMQSVTTGDIDTFERLLTNPDAVTIADQRTVAEKLGIKKGLLSAFVNVGSDPTVWLAYWMSRRFPTSAWLRGSIPQRFVGDDAKYTGLSFVGRPIEGFFRGTNIPRLTALAQYRQGKVMEVARGMFQRFMDRPNWKDEMPIVSMLREGLDPPGATPELRGIADGIGKDMDELWGFLKQAWRVEGGFDGVDVTRARTRPMDAREAPKYLRNYVPHIPLTTNESVVRMSGTEALRAMAKSNKSQALKVKGERLLDVWTPDKADRLSSDFGRYQAAMNRFGAEIFNPRLFQRHRTNLNLQNGQDLLVTDLNYILQRYVHGVARTYSLNAPITDAERAMVGLNTWRMPTNEPIIAQVINEGLDASGATYAQRTRRIRGTNRVIETVVPGSENAPVRTALRQLVRNLKGESSEDEILFGNMFSAVRQKLSDWGQANGVHKLAINKTDAAISSFERNADYRRMSNGLASYFYGTTLGLNPWSAMQNLLQPILTTGPAIGLGSVVAGMRTLRERMPRYATEIGNQMRLLRANPQFAGPTGAIRRLNIGSERAFELTFPELAQQGIKIDPRVFDVDERTLQDIGMGRAGFTKRDDIFRFIMQPFTFSEQANRISTFYGAKHAIAKAMKTGEYEIPASTRTGQPMGADELNDLLNFEAGIATRELQFTPGPGSKTVWQNILPAPLRQFTSFFTRLGSHMADSTVKGAMTNQAMQDVRVFKTLQARGVTALNPFASDAESVAAQQKLLSFGTGRNMGTLARMFLYSRILTDGMRDTIGVDLSAAVGLTGPFQSMSSDDLSIALPVPPIPKALFATVGAATTRDMKRLQPMRLPGIGEIPIPRTLIPGGVAISRAVRAVQSFRPDLGGFVDDDERLMYRSGTPEMILAALGVPLDKQRRSRDIMERVHANRTAIRNYRRRFSVAAMNADYETIDGLRQSYAEQFPDMPALDVSDKDVDRYREQARMTSVQRMLGTMGEAGRFLEQDIYEFEPELLAPRFPGF
ncbi:MAG: hypothetical protein ACKV2Q_36430 [Planctomycetaceae bacterium]